MMRILPFPLALASLLSPATSFFTTAIRRQNISPLLQTLGKQHSGFLHPHCLISHRTKKWDQFRDLQNKYARLRQRVSAQKATRDINDDVIRMESHINDADDPRSLAEQAFSVLARKGRTWRRLGHMVDLAIGDGNVTIESKDTARTIADIGCDHGLLAIGLAVSGKFEKVIGIDVSERALVDGALALQTQVLTVLNPDDDDTTGGTIMKGGVSPDQDYDQSIPVEFRVGDGLHVLDNGEADSVCIAGMGVNTMLKIISQQETDRLRCQQLILQPTNSKPKNLVRLYDELQRIGWRVAEERIEKLSSRHYISVRFEMTSSRQSVLDDSVLPGQKLSELDEHSTMHILHEEYVQLHKSWLQRDFEKAGSLYDGELRWLESNRIELSITD